jgi:DtxR family transcriptional regulator, Mn-dependent transcriptional regulator
MLNYSVSEENYIKAIFHLQKQTGIVTTNELSGELKTSPASVTDMMKKLKAKKLLHYQPYRGFSLNPEGNKVAIGIIRRHRLWEYFLAEKLKFSWDEVHAVAEELEHVRSQQLIDKLDEFLGFPKTDPHGDPIPDINGKIEMNRMICFTDFPFNKQGLVAHVTNQSTEILSLLKHRNINIGTRLEKIRKFEFDQSIEVRNGKNPLFTITKELAENIYLKTL